MAENHGTSIDRLLSRDLTFGTICTLVILAGIGLAHATALPWGVAAALGMSLAYLALYDIRFMLLPDAVSLPLIALGFVNVIWSEPPFWDRLIGAAVGFIVLPAINSVYRHLRGRDGIGLGDAKLLAAAGAWLGWAQLPLVLLVSSVMGLLVAVILALRARRFQGDRVLPFGPFIAVGFFLVFLWGLVPESLGSSPIS